MSPRLTQAIASARVAIAALDLSAEANELTQIEHELTQIGAAELNAQERSQAIGRTLAEKTEMVPGRIADQLLASAGSSLADAAPSRADLEHERETLSRGMAELVRRSRKRGQEIDHVRERAKKRLGTALAPIVTAIAADAQEAAQKLRDSFAALTAIGRAAPIERALQNAMDDAMKGLGGAAYHKGLLPRGDPAPVPAEVVELLAKIDKRPVLIVPVIREASTRNL